MSAEYRSGFVGIVGRPNVGKSTILNYYLRDKIAIVSPQPQTTRFRILGVFTQDDAQVMFIDTPGFHKPKHKLGRYMVEVAKAAIDEADVLVAVIDARTGITLDDERIFDHIKRTAYDAKLQKPRRHVLLAINKTDSVKKPRLLQIIDTCRKTMIFSEYVPISALTGDQMDILLKHIIALLPPGVRWYEPQMRTDQTTSQLVSELIREQILHLVYQEVPHTIAVRIEEMKEQGRVIAIRATILVERQGQKAIVIGKGGLMLKQVGQRARKQIERLLGRKIYLELWVKVESNWRSNERILEELGYICE